LAEALQDVDRMYGRIPEKLRKDPDFKKFMKKAGPILSKGAGGPGYKGATLTLGGKYGDSYTIPPEDAKTLVNTKSLVRQGKKIAAKGSEKFATKALQKTAGLASRGMAALWGTPAVVAADLLLSSEVGIDQYGRHIDTPKGFEAAEKDNAIADYYSTYGSFPENYNADDHNQNAIIDRIESTVRSETMAAMLRQESGKQSQPTPEELARKKWRSSILRHEVITGENPMHEMGGGS